MTTQARQPRAHRIRHRSPVRFANALLGEFSGHTIDLSPHGLAIWSQLVPHSQMRLTVWLENEGVKTPLHAHVRWRSPDKPGTFGVQFESINPAYLRFLSTLGSRRVAPGILLPPERSDATEAGEETRPRADVLGSPAGASPLQTAPYVPRLARFPEQLPVHFGTGKRLTGHGFTFDISTRGVGMHARDIPSAGTELRLALSLPDGGNARVEGTVMWMRAARSREPSSAAGVRVDVADGTFYQLVIERVRAQHNRWLSPPEQSFTEE